MVFDGRHKLIERAGDVAQLYDLADDPAELMNLAEREPAMVSRLHELLTDELGPTEAH